MTPEVPGTGSPDHEEPILITPEMLAPARAVKPAARRDGRIDFERGMRRLPLFIATLIVANVAVFAWEIASGAFLDRKSLIESGLHVANQINPLEAGALVRVRVLAGEWWRVFTSMFLHGGPDHLIGNMVALYIVGMACEHAFGAARTALVYFGSGVTGAAFSLATGPGPSVGASGAIFGVLAAVAVMLYKNQDRFYVRDNVAVHRQLRALGRHDRRCAGRLAADSHIDEARNSGSGLSGRSKRNCGGQTAMPLTVTPTASHPHRGIAPPRNSTRGSQARSLPDRPPPPTPGDRGESPPAPPWSRREP